ncbi:unnamed protein product [Aureobasidium pullulans]|nr:unnamed protein product [Aureobasidium pullulans]
MPPKKTKKVDKAKDNKPTVKTRAMARAEAAAAAPVAGTIPVVAPVAAPLATLSRLASVLEKRQHQSQLQGCETGTKTLAKQWKKHGLTLRELLDLYNHTGPAVEEPTRSALEKKCKEYGLNTVGATLWDLDKAVTLYELAAKKRLYDLPQGEMEDIVSALWSVQAQAANGKRLDEDQRRNRDNEIMNQEVVTISSGGQTQQFTQEQGHGTTFEERYPVNSRVIDLWEEVMHQPDGTTNPARLSRRALYRAMQWDSINARDGSLEVRLYNMQMGDIDMVQLVADALDVEIFTYTPQYESDGTTSWIRLARGQPQTDPQRQIHIANYMHSIHWTALRPVGTFAMPDLDPMATTPNFTLDPPGPVPRLPIGHIDNFDLRPEARRDDPEDGHVADCTVRDLADGETEEATEDEYEYEYEDEDMDEEEEEQAEEGEGEGEEGKEEQEEDDEEQYEFYEYYDEDGTPSAGGNGGGVPTVVVSHSPSSKSSPWNDRNGERPLLALDHLQEIKSTFHAEQIILKFRSRFCFEVIVGTTHVSIAAKLILDIKPTLRAV